MSVSHEDRRSVWDVTFALLELAKMFNNNNNNFYLYSAFHKTFISKRFTILIQLKLDIVMTREQI